MSKLSFHRKESFIKLGEHRDTNTGWQKLADFRVHLFKFATKRENWHVSLENVPFCLHTIDCALIKIGLWPCDRRSPTSATINEHTVEYKGNTKYDLQIQFENQRGQ